MEWDATRLEEHSSPCFSSSSSPHIQNMHSNPPSHLLSKCQTYAASSSQMGRCAACYLIVGQNNRCKYVLLGFDSLAAVPQRTFQDFVFLWSSLWKTVASWNVWRPLKSYSVWRRMWEKMSGAHLSSFLRFPSCLFYCVRCCHPSFVLSGFQCCRWRGSSVVESANTSPPPPESGWGEFCVFQSVLAASLG